MDFGTIDSRDAADKGRDLHLCHPILGHLLYVGDGANTDGELIDRKKSHDAITLKVRGYHSPKVQKALNVGKKKTVRTDSETEELGEDFCDALIVSWANVEARGKPLKCTKENKVWLIEQDPGLFQQVHKFAEDRANFFDKAPRS